jgi:hypothetical protein
MKNTINYQIYRSYAGTTDFAGKKRETTDPVFTLYSQTGQKFTGGDWQKPHGTYATLSEAAQAGDDLLASITHDSIRASSPGFSDEAVERWANLVTARLRQTSRPQP